MSAWMQAKGRHRTLTQHPPQRRKEEYHEDPNKRYRNRCYKN